MRIISKWRDFYDAGTAYGIDMDLVYTRTTREEQFQYDESRGLAQYGRLPGIAGVFEKIQFRYNNVISILGLCGELIPFVDFRQDYVNSQVFYGRDIYKWQEPNRFQKQNRLVEADRWAQERRRQFVEYLENSPENYIKLFDALNTPIWILQAPHSYNQRILIANPSLTSIKFGKQRDAVEVFQMISQFVARLNADQSPPVEIADKYRITQHGFDDKKSFRRQTHPGKPRDKK